MIFRLRALSRQEARQLDVQALEECALPTLILMENAGRGAAQWLAHRITESARGESRPTAQALASIRQIDSQRVMALPKVIILCGPGNNGGDGAVVARHLDAWGFPVRVVWFARADQLRGDAAIQWTILARSGVDQSSWLERDPAGDTSDADRLGMLLADSDWVIDALLGTGLARPVDGMLRGAIEVINRADKPILALDIPSGLDADTGTPLGIAVRATATATFVAPKLGFSAAGATDFTGEVAVIDIGLPRTLLVPYQI